MWDLRFRMRGVADVALVEDVGARAPGEPALQFRRTNDALLPYIESFYLYDNRADRIEGVERVDLGQLRFFLEGEGQVTFPDGRCEPTCPITVTGPGTAHWDYAIRGPFRCFGLSLRGIGWKSLIGLPADQVADQIIDGAALFGADAVALLGQLRAKTTLDAMVELLQPHLMRRLRAARPVPRSHIAFLRVVREWAASGDPTLDALYAAMEDETGMGQRQVQRLCKEYYAGPPNHLRRKFRAIWAAMRIYRGDPLSDVVAPFADQSHLINEVKHFTGHTPGTLRDGIDPVLAATLETESFHFLPDVIPEAVDLTHR